MSEVFDDTRVINLRATRINLGASLTHLKVCCLIVTCKHTGGCAVKVFPFILANYLIFRYSAI